MRRLTGAVALLLASQVSAGPFLEVSPPVVELSVPAGQESKGQITVRNNGDTESLIEVEVRDSWTERTGQPSLPPSKWLAVLLPKPFALKPGASQNITYKVKPPADFTGEAMAMVLFSGPTKTEPGTPANVAYRHGIPIYLIAQGTEKVVLTPRAFEAFGAAGAPPEFFVEVKNEGNIHLRPQGSVRIENKKGEAVAEVPFSYGTPVFPNQTSKYFAKAAQKLPNGPYTAKGVLLKSAGGDRLAEFQLTFTVSKAGIKITEPFGAAVAP